MSSALLAQEAKVTDLMSKYLPNLPGKEGLMITVQYPPGSVDPIHRHNANGFIYVLEGTIVMQVRGGKETTVRAGQTFYELLIENMVRLEERSPEKAAFYHCVDRSSQYGVHLARVVILRNAVS